MGFTYLNGKRWTQVTREERFFCQRLYELARSEPVDIFAQYISQKLNLDLPRNCEWEIGYEVCFYRDLWQLRGRNEKLYSPKRTFDLCLFSESAIVIIEAKAAVGFDQGQNAMFVRDIEEVRGLTRVKDIHLIGLCSSRCELDCECEAVFHGKVIRWSDLANHYGGDAILARADEIYEYHEAFANRGRHSDIKLTGTALLEAFQGGAEWWVGRGGGGIAGEMFSEDVRTGRWKTQLYEVSTKADQPPSPNYFGLGDFVRAVGQFGSEPDDA